MEYYGEKPSKKIMSAKNKMTTNDDDDFDTAYQESIEQYNKEEMKTESYFLDIKNKSKLHCTDQENSGGPMCPMTVNMSLMITAFAPIYSLMDREK